MAAMDGRNETESEMSGERSVLDRFWKCVLVGAEATSHASSLKQMAFGRIFV